MSILSQLHVVEGAMACPNCKHIYPISDGIPNMVSNILDDTDKNRLIFEFP